MKNHFKQESRRTFIKQSSSIALGLGVVPYLNLGNIGIKEPVKRTFGRIGFEVTTFGLGGQASIQWTPEDVDPVRIILKAFDNKVNYFDTSNLYGPSQLNFGKAFRELSLIPGTSGYNEGLRKNIFLTSKTHLRWSKGNPMVEGVSNWSNGDTEGGTVGDLKRSLSQIYGDGKGNYPAGAYLDMVLIHNLNTKQEVDALYTGLKKTSSQMQSIGALAALRDYRDGTNLTGLNPGEEKLIRHIGFSGHFSAPVMMDMIQRDDENLLDAMLVAINANDRLNFNMQHNVIPIAKARNMGIIAMKVFADGAMYTKDATWSNVPEHVVRTIGSKELPSRPLVEYSLTTPGIQTAIMGIGEINDNPKKCQLIQNLSSAQIKPGDLTSHERNEIESLAGYAKLGMTNYFQKKAEPLSPPRNPRIEMTDREGIKEALISWDSAYAGNEPIQYYQVMRDFAKAGLVDHQPQTSKKPFSISVALEDQKHHEFKVLAVDSSGQVAESDVIKG
jgi:aryl-alcohol dehydrogenase-like predicted oxidoreductase